MSAARKAHNPFVLVSDPSNYDGSRAEIGVNNGSGGIGLWMRDRAEIRGPRASLTPTQAREIAKDLNERADELDPPTRGKAHDIIEGVLGDVITPEGLDDEDGVTHTACSLAITVGSALHSAGLLTGDPND
ncbi:hypothetical protein SEA_NAMAGO_76 [Microbacterium phage Namago]|nr:hypothetical protein SEA_NAMAGO_76 [Microbacterium phage Namago]